MNADEFTDRPVESTTEEESLRPTYAPVSMAMGIAMTAWGLLALTLNINAMWFMSLFGVGLMIWAVRSWIGEIVLQWESTR